MSIRFKCPHCQKALVVKDEVAGKKGACPACKQAVQIPVPVSQAEAESLAISMFADSPAPQAEAQATPVPEAASANGTIDFDCPMCGDPIKLSAELGGKQAPCPLCKNIIKVPKLKADEKKDWRAMHTRPSAALANQPAAPGGAWGSATHKGKVSGEALEEAGRVP